MYISVSTSVHLYITCTDKCTHDTYTHIYEVFQVCTHNMNISKTIFQYFAKIFQYFAVTFVMELNVLSFLHTVVNTLHTLFQYFQSFF